MASFVIEGGHRLSGEIHPQGAKNEVFADNLCHIANRRGSNGEQYT